MEGFLRSLSADIFGAATFVVVVGIAYFVLTYTIRRRGGKDGAGTLRVLRIAVVAILLLTGVTLLGRAASVAFANRIPRNDVDKSPVYEQMKSHGQDQNPR